MLRSPFAVALAAAAALCSFAAHAQNSVLYGVLDASGSRGRAPGGFYQYRLDSGAMTQSYLGFRGSEDLGGGLRAVFKLESYVRLDTGQSGRTNADGFWGRDANIGLSGNFGTTVIGRNVTPLYLTTITFNPFGESFGFSPATRQYFGGGAVLGDRSWNNSISYTNNLRDPLRVHFVYNLPEDSADTPNQGKNFGVSGSYLSGPFAAALAVERIRNSGQAVPAGFDRQDAVQASLTYDFKLVRLYGQAGWVKTYATVDKRTTLWHLGAAVPIGNSLILVGYGRAQAKTDTSQITDRTVSLGYDYFLSKNTDIYVAGLHEKTFQLSSGNSIAGGVRVRF